MDFFLVSRCDCIIISNGCLIFYWEDVEGPIFGDLKSLCAVLLFIRNLGELLTHRTWGEAEGLKEGHQERLVAQLPRAERLNLIPGQLVSPEGRCLERWLSLGISNTRSLGLPQEAAWSPGEGLFGGRWPWRSHLTPAGVQKALICQMRTLPFLQLVLESVLCNWV